MEENFSFMHLLMCLFYNSWKEILDFFFNMFLHMAVCLLLYDIFLRDLISEQKKCSANFP